MAKMDPGQAAVVSESLINIIGIATAIENHDTGSPPDPEVLSDAEYAAKSRQEEEKRQKDIREGRTPKPTQYPADRSASKHPLKLKKEGAGDEEGHDMDRPAQTGREGGSESGKRTTYGAAPGQHEGEAPEAILAAEDGKKLVEGIRALVASGDMVAMTEMVESIIDDCLDMVEDAQGGAGDEGATRSSRRRKGTDDERETKEHKKGR